MCHPSLHTVYDPHAHSENAKMLLFLPLLVVDIIMDVCTKCHTNQKYFEIFQYGSSWWTTTQQNLSETNTEHLKFRICWCNLLNEKVNNK